MKRQVGKCFQLVNSFIWGVQYTCILYSSNSIDSVWKCFECDTVRGVEEFFSTLHMFSGKSYATSILTKL